MRSSILGASCGGQAGSGGDLTGSSGAPGGLGGSAGLAGSGGSGGRAGADATGPDPLLEVLSANDSLVVSYGSEVRDFEDWRTYRLVITDMTQGTADGWTSTGAPMIGNGVALHMVWHQSTSNPLVISNSVGSNGICFDASPNSVATDPRKPYINFFVWSGAEVTLHLCSLGGTAVLDTADSRTITFNVAFSDGTYWIDKTFSLD